MLPYRQGSLSSLVALLLPRSVEGLTRYRNFFSNYNLPLAGLVDGNCSAAYEGYVQRTPAYLTNPLLAYWGKTDHAWPLVECLLEAAPEAVKADFSSTQVLLGLMPTILNNLGPSSKELSLLLVLGERQFLALCLALGAPFTDNTHTFGYTQEIKALSPSAEDAPSAFCGWQRSIPVLCLEYLIAFASIANIAELSYELAVKISSTISQGTFYLPALWAILGFVVHLLMAFALCFRLRVEVKRTGEDDNRFRWNPVRLTKWTNRQFNAIDRDGQGSIKLLPANIPYMILSYFIKAFIVAHIGFGVLTFSSVLFLSVNDGVGIFFRYFGSVLACRVVVANEIAVLKANIKRRVNAPSQPLSTSPPPPTKELDYHLCNDPGLPLAIR